MTKPNAKKHNPDPYYLRGILKEKGVTQQQAADQIGLNVRTLRKYLSFTEKERAAYYVQYCLENL